MPETDARRPPVAEGVTLYEHQRAGFERALQVFSGEGPQGYGFLFEMGLGKSLTAIATMGQLFLDGKIDRVLVCAPTSVCNVWPAELGRFAGFPFACQVLTGDSAKRRAALRALRPRTVRTLLVAILNYESTWRIEEDLAEWNPDLIVCDESQRIKNPRAAQSKALHRLGDRAKYKLILSGTPVSNSPLDLWSQYRFLNPRVFGTSYFQFEKKHAIMGGPVIGGKPRKLMGFRGLDEVMERAYRIASRATKADALDLPEKTFERRPVPLSPAEMRAYRQMQFESLAWLGAHEVTAQNVLTKMLRLQQITGGFLKPDDGGPTQQLGSSKLDALRDIVEDYVLDGGQKLVVFFRFKAEGLAICRMLREILKVPVNAPPAFGFLDGDTPQVERDHQVRRFQTSPDSKVFVTNMATGGAGITLNAASAMVFYSWNFSYMDYAQAQDRIHRIGQRHPCHYVHLVAPGTIDEHILAALESKQDMAVSLVDDQWKRIFEGG
jgi:SNF2 family DNA or RNA helicase